MAEPQRHASIVWHPSTTPADAALGEHVAGLLGVPPELVRTGRLCPVCGSEKHGRPWASGGLHVSLSRSGPHLVTAAAHRRVGVDVEAVDEVSQRWDPEQVVHVDEHPGSPEEAARLWCRKEAILKMLGTGLVVPMSSLRSSDYEVDDVTAPRGYVAALATEASQHG